MKRLHAVVVLVLILSPRLAAQQSGAKPAPPTTLYKTENAWSVGETLADISEIAAVVTGAAAKPDQPVAGLIVWDPVSFVSAARSRLGSFRSLADQPRLDGTATRLLDPSAVSIADAAGRIDAALRRNMRSADAHEAAALALGGLGLREAAKSFGDPRWALNRMTAHLAVAAALRPGPVETLEGKLARATLLALTMRQASALSAIAAIEKTDSDPTAKAWCRVLRMRVTGDWRALSSPGAATKLEKLEYFRARRFALGSRAGADLDLLHDTDTTRYARIVVGARWGVEDGEDFVEPAAAIELGEAAAVFRSVNRSEPGDPIEMLNARAGRLMSSGTVRVIGWGGWAEFFQRHLCSALLELDVLYRSMEGLPDRANQIKRDADAKFSNLRLYPLVFASRRSAPNKTFDWSQISSAVRLVETTPELVTFSFWTWLDDTIRRRNPALPSTTEWFPRPSPMAPFEIGLRADQGKWEVSNAQLEAQLATAPFDMWLLPFVLRMAQPMIAKAPALLRQRADYDVRAIDDLMRPVQDVKERVVLRAKACQLQIERCEFAVEDLIDSGSEAEAAAMFERMYGDPALDRVTMANSAQWLVLYYMRTNRMPQALKLASEANEVFSYGGINTLAFYYEKTGDLAQAEELFVRASKRYNNTSDLLGFYYRQAELGREQQFKDAWLRELKIVFPNGLQPVPKEMASSGPGLVVYQDSPESRKGGAIESDVIIGVDGFRVQNRRQFDAVGAFKRGERLQDLTVRRGGLLLSARVKRRGRLLAMDLRPYPNTNQ